MTPVCSSVQLLCSVDRRSFGGRRRDSGAKSSVNISLPRIMEDAIRRRLAHTKIRASISAGRVFSTGRCCYCTHRLL